MGDVVIRRRSNPQAAALLMAKADQARIDGNMDTVFALAAVAHELVHPCDDRSTEHLIAWVEGYVQPTVHELAAGALLDPYLDPDNPPDGWHLIDNADADDVRHALEVAIQRMRDTLAYADHATRGMVHMGLTDRLNGRRRG